MKFMNKSAVALYAFIAISGSTHASVFTFGELLFKPISIKSKIVKEGVSGASVTSLRESIGNSVDAIAHGHPDLSAGLKDIRDRSGTNSADKAKIGRILAALKMSHDSISGERFKDIVNDMAYIASVYGEDASKILNCSYCKTQQLSSLGFRSNLMKVANRDLRKLIGRLPNNSTSIDRYISRLTQKHKIKNVARYMDKSERKALALFLTFNERGASKEYKDFYKAVTMFNTTKNGEVVLAGPAANGTFWKLIDGKFSPERAGKIAIAINEASKKNIAKREEEFYKQLYKVSDKSPEAASSIEELKSKKCFFK